MDIISINHRPDNLRRYESVYDVVHMDEPFEFEDIDGGKIIDYTTHGWNAGIYVMFPLDETVEPFLMTAAEFRGRYRLQK